MNFENKPYISISYKPQPNHNPKKIKHRRIPQHTEKFRIYYTNKQFFMVCINKKHNKGYVGGAWDLLRIVNNTFKNKHSCEVLVCHPTGFSKQQELKNLIHTSEQNLQKYLLLLIWFVKGVIANIRHSKTEG